MNVERRKFGRASSTRKIQQIVDDVRGAISLPSNFFQQGMLGIVFRQHVQEHLGVRRNTGERGVNFVRDAGGEQSDRRKLFTLLKLIFETQTLSHIFKNNQGSRLFLG